MSVVCVESACAAVRLKRASQWLSRQAAGQEALVVAPSLEAANAVIRRAVLATESAASFGWHRATLGRLAAGLATPALTELHLAPASSMALEALCARVLHRLDDLGRFEAVADRPGLPRALVHTFAELRIAGCDPSQLPDDLAGLFNAYLGELEASRLADRARVFELATQALAGSSSDPRVGLPLLLVDPQLDGTVDQTFVSALVAASTDVLVVAAAGEGPMSERLVTALGDDASRERVHSEADDTLASLQTRLFRDAVESSPREPDAHVQVFSTPGEALECVEIARRIHREAEQGTPFDRMAVLLRTPGQYRGHLEEALRRGGVPAFFAHGTVQPDPSGRAFLALLACAAENLSATRFAEYLSLAQSPRATESGEPPAAPPAEERWSPPDTELVSEVITEAVESLPSRAEEDDVLSEDEPVVAGGLRAPRRWEKLMMDAAVIGGLDRWKARLDNLESELRKDLGALDDPDDPASGVIERDLAALEALRNFALPLIELLADRPSRGSWGQWLEWLSVLATRALERPERVLATLAELAPMAEVDGVGLREVRLVLGRRLTDLLTRPGTETGGKVYVCDIDSVRGLDFDVVFVPGLAEKLFPAKLVEDPILADRLRVELPGLATNDDRARSERILLRRAVGAASRRVHLSYPRLDVNQSRPRVPSFYGLEVLRAAEGALPDFGTLMHRAQQASPTRLGWPAPADTMEAIDEAEHDLALLARVFERKESDTVGMARYLLHVNPHLRRALRFRARRWFGRWTPADGLVMPTDEAKKALHAHRLSERSFSPTALQKYAACPYQFFLYAVLRLKPREEIEAIDVMNPLQRGSLVHEVLYELHTELKKQQLLPVTSSNLERARDVLDQTLDAVEESWRSELNPVVPKVWDDELALIRGDLREWLRRQAAGERWVPEYFELSFGLRGRREQDPASVDQAVALDCGIQLRGSIDLIERNAAGKLRATDYKTGKVRVNQNAVISGGEALQPVLYALTVEKLMDAQVEGGRLYYCTTAGNFEERYIPLSPTAREAANVLADTIGQAVEHGFLPAAPNKGACRWCDYQPVCGPYEEYRTLRKPKDQLKPLATLRNWK